MALRVLNDKAQGRQITWFTLVILGATLVSGHDPPVFIDQGIAPGALGCVDVEPKCSVWASQGECQTNAAWMMSNCRRSCQSCQGGERAWQLRLTIAANYDNNNSVSRNISMHHVNIHSFHVEHIEMDETKQMAKMHGKMVLTWNDSRIVWDKNHWEVSWLNFYWVQIWTPQVVQSNAPPSYPSQFTSKILAANYTGQVYMWTDFSLNTLCEMDYRNFPYDKQKCSFKLDDRRFYVVRFSVADSAKQEAKMSTQKVHPAGWQTQNVDIMESRYSIQMLADWGMDPFNVETANVEVSLTLKRDHSYYGAQITGPLVASAIVTLVSFMAGSFWNQLALLLVSLLFQIVAVYPISSALPPASGQVPAILKFSSFNLTMTCIVLIISACLLTLCLVENVLPPPRFVMLFTECLQKFAPCIGVKIDETKFGHDGTTPVDPTMTTPSKTYQWGQVARTVKCMLFLLYLVMYIFAMFACLIV